MSISLEYIAGFFDGEGSVGIYHRTYKTHWIGHQLRTQVCQNASDESRSLSSELISLFGGNASTQGKKWNWQLNSVKAANFLRAILPHILLKKEQVRVALAWQNSRPPVIRFPDGVSRFASPVDLAWDDRVADLLKALKHNSVSSVLADSVHSLVYQEVMRHFDSTCDAHITPIINIKA